MVQFSMKRLFISGLLSLALLPQSGLATDLYYTNNGDITFPPQIDAINVINNGSFDFSLNPTTRPFDTSNTRNFTNNGIMLGSVGFRFDNAPSTGIRKLSANFRNRLAGRITAPDSFALLSQINGFPVDTTLVNPSYLWIAATNVINEGVLTAGAGGILRVVGTNVTLSRSGLQIEPVSARGSTNGYFTNFFTPEVAIYDYYWGQTNQVMNSSAIIRNGGAQIVSPRSAVEFTGGFVGSAQIGVSPSFGDFYTNTLATTNISITNMMGMPSTTNVALTNIVQAVFVGIPGSGDVDGEVRFFPSEDFQNPFRTVSVRLTLASTNVVSVSPELASVYLVDTLASATNRSFYTNFISISDLRPQNYLLQRDEPFEYFFGSGGNAQFSPDMLYKPDFASPIVTNEYAAYGAFIDSISSRPPNIPSGTVTNLPGRIEVVAENLDISRTRFRATGLLDIQAKNLVGSSNTVVDCENLSYTLGSTNGSLKIQSLAQEAVSRFQGTSYVWSGLWTNQQNMLIENYIQDPADTNRYIPSPITNVVEVRIYAMILNAQQMLTQVPVVVNNLTTHSTNVVLNDHMTIVQTLRINGESFTINGGITLSNTFFIDTLGNIVVISLDSWVATNAPNLKYFTNNGTLYIPNEGHFGDDRATPYAVFDNQGRIEAYGQTIRSEYCGIGGELISAGGLSIISRSAKMEGGTLTSGGDVQLFGNDVKLTRSAIQTGSRLDLTVTNSLFDAGGGSGNSLTCSDGFRLLIKPQTGDLLGTQIESIAPAFAEVDHEWAGEDRGATPAGFLNNTAVGTLLLTPGEFEAQYPPLFFFAGQRANNALYVDLLDLSQLLDYQNELFINPDLKIYFAAAKLGFTPPLTNGAAQQAEEYLDGQFDGRLRWVRDFAGPSSSVDVIINGKTAKMNRALRNSRIVDSDGDGVPNFFDLNPFDPALVVKGAMVETNTPPAKGFLVSWTAKSNTVYRVEYTANMQQADWQLLLRYTNNAPTNRVVSIWDTNVSSVNSPRFYRVGFSQ